MFLSGPTLLLLVVFNPKPLLTQGLVCPKENREPNMETGLSGHPLTPQLPTDRPGPLFHQLERLRTMGGDATVRKLKCILDSLEFTERYFAGEHLVHICY